MIYPVIFAFVYSIIIYSSAKLLCEHLYPKQKIIFSTTHKFFCVVTGILIGSQIGYFVCVY